MVWYEFLHKGARTRCVIDTQFDRSTTECSWPHTNSAPSSASTREEWRSRTLLARRNRRLPSSRNPYSITIWNHIQFSENIALPEPHCPGNATGAYSSALSCMSATLNIHSEVATISSCFNALMLWGRCVSRDRDRLENAVQSELGNPTSPPTECRRLLQLTERASGRGRDRSYRSSLYSSRAIAVPADVCAHHRQLAGLWNSQISGVAVLQSSKTRARKLLHGGCRLFSFLRLTACENLQSHGSGQIYCSVGLPAWRPCAVE